MHILMNFFLIKMTGVNTFCEVLSLNKNITVQREPPGILFKYLDSQVILTLEKKISKCCKT